MVTLNTLKPAKGSIKKAKRVGRGNASGNGTTAGRGHKGQKSRSGSHLPYVGFEGGQNPIYKRTPKLGGFNNFNKRYYAVINTGDLEKNFANGDSVTIDTLKEKNLIRKNEKLLKILATGDISISLTVEADLFSKTAKGKIEKAGGNCKVRENKGS